MIKIIVYSYTELNNLKEGDSYSIAQINWWLLKYGDLYKECLSVNSKLCGVCIELQNENLPYDCLSKPDYCNKKSEQSSFIKFYDELDEVSKLNKLEEKCFLAYDEYTFLCCVNEDLRDWVIQHYDVYEELQSYLFNYPGSNSEENKNLYIVEAPDESFNVIVREEDLKNTISFYDVYYDLYYNQKLYPEKIKERDEFFSKIKRPKDEL